MNRRIIWIIAILVIAIALCALLIRKGQESAMNPTGGTEMTTDPTDGTETEATGTGTNSSGQGTEPQPTLGESVQEWDDNAATNNSGSSNTSSNTGSNTSSNSGSNTSSNTGSNSGQTESSQPATEPKPSESTQPSTGGAQDDRLAYEIYMDLSSEKKQEFFETFADPEKFFDWRDAAKAEYDQKLSGNVIQGGGSVDLRDYIDKFTNNN